MYSCGWGLCNFDCFKMFLFDKTARFPGNNISDLLKCEIRRAFRGFAPLNPHQDSALEPLGGLLHPQAPAESSFLSGRTTPKLPSTPLIIASSRHYSLKCIFADVISIKQKRFDNLSIKQVPFCGERSDWPERSALRSRNNSYKILHTKKLHSKKHPCKLCKQFSTILWVLRRKFSCTSSGHGFNYNNTYTSFHNSAHSTRWYSFNLKLKPLTSRTTHFREIFRKSFHHMNTNKGGIVKQSGNDAEGYLSQKVLFQPNVRVFLQYSVNS